MKPDGIKIADTLTLPIAILTSTIGVLGIRGSGKTNTAGVVVEEATRLGVPSAVADPTGAWWGIKSSADGKEPGLPFYVFGGEHADVPLEAEAGEIMARFAIERRVPMVLDLNLMTKGRQLHFMAEYAAALYHGNREAFLQVIDETARFCPQSIRDKDPDASKCLGAVEDLGALGRVKGLGLIIVGQRAAKINKDVLTQCHTLIVHQTNSPQDKKSVDEWIGEQYGRGKERDEFLEALPRLKTGEAFVWSPTFNIYERVQVRKRTTFDSSKTPEIGKRVVGPKVFASVDLEQLSVELGEAKQRAIDNDPKQLRAQISDLKRQLAAKPAGPPKIIELPLVTPEMHDELRDIYDRMAGLFAKAFRDLEAKVAPIANAVLTMDARVVEQLGRDKSNSRLPASAFDGSALRVLEQEAKFVEKRVRAFATAKTIIDPAAKLSKGEIDVLKAILQVGADVTRDSITVMTGFKRSTRDAYIQRLAGKGAIVTTLGQLAVTEGGVAMLGDSYEPLPTGAALRQFWLDRLPAGERLILDHLIFAYPKGMAREDLSHSTGFARSTRDAYLQRLRSRRLIETAAKDVTAAARLFEK